MNLPSVSVLVCSKNGGIKLARMLQSLQAQDLSLAEIILIDDGSDQPLAPICPGLRLIRRDRSQGCIPCRNELAALAKGEWMVFVDDDVILDDPQLLSKAMILLRQDPTVGALGFLQRSVDGKLLNLQPCRGNGTEWVPTYYGWAHIILRGAWLKAGPFAEAFTYGWEETEFCLRLLDCGYKVVSNPTLSVIHDSTSSAKNLPRRHFLNDRNMLLMIALHHPARVVPSWVKNSILRCHPEQSSNESLLIYRLRLLWATFSKAPYVFRNRRPVSAQTLKTFYRLPRQVGLTDVGANDMPCG